jgi:quercetin dioxygenase-like cupin family protein
MLQGEFELTVEGTPLMLVAGDVVILKSGVEHAGRAITDCRILDVFQPVRQDYVFDDEIGEQKRPRGAIVAE